MEIFHLLWVSVLLLYQHEPENRELYLNITNRCYNLQITRHHTKQNFMILPITHFCILKQQNS